MANRSPIISTRQTAFSGGISDDQRAARLYRGNFLADSFSIAKHFDIFSKPEQLIPYRSFTADTNDGSTSTGMKQYFVRDFLYGSTSSTLYGLGQNGGGQAKIVYKANPTSGNWTLPTSSEGNGAVQNGCLVEYKDYLWGFQGTTQVFKWGTISGGSGSITNSAGTVGTITSVAQGIIGKDDNLYLPYNNKLARVTSGGTVNDAVLTLPTNYKITSLDNYGLYLAIGCAPISTFNGASKVFLWNLTSTDVQEVIDWGEGELRVIGTIEGQIIGVTDRYLNNSTGAGIGSMIVQAYAGGSPQVVKEIFTKALTGKSIPLTKAIKNNRLFFAAKIMTNAAGTEYNEGIWSYGRKSAAYPYVLSLDFIDENVSTAGIQAFGNAANFFFIAHSSDGSIDMTSNTATYTFTSILESQIFNWGTSAIDKRLERVRVSFRKLATGESLTLKYKVDEASSWTTIGTYNTVAGLSHTFLNEEGTKDFASGREFQFRLESTGGLEIVGFEAEASFFNAP